jgi:hypothetical protein
VGHAPPHAISISVATGLIGGGVTTLHTPTEELIPMTDDRLPLAELMAKTGDGDFLRTIAESVLQIIMEADVDGLVGAGRHERSGDRTTWRNGYRDRSLDTRLGTLNLKIPCCGLALTFRAFWNRGRPLRKRWSR